MLSADEIELAPRSARRKNLDIETVLIDEFQVKSRRIGEALSEFFGVPYEPFKPDRVKPLDLLKNLKREYVESSQWVPIDDTKDGLVVLTTDPERVRASRIVNNMFPKARSSTGSPRSRNSATTLDQFFGADAGRRPATSATCSPTWTTTATRRRRRRGRRSPRPPTTSW